MKQKPRLKNSGNIGYRYMNGWYIGSSPKKPYWSICIDNKGLWNIVCIQ